MEELTDYLDALVEGDQEKLRSTEREAAKSEEEAMPAKAQKLYDFFQSKRVRSEELADIRRAVEEEISAKAVELARKSAKVIQIVERASSDESFRQALLESPEHAAESLGLTLNPYELAALSDLREDDMAAHPRQLDERILKRRGPNPF